MGFWIAWLKIPGYDLFTFLDRAPKFRGPVTYLTSVRYWSLYTTADPGAASVAMATGCSQLVGICERLKSLACRSGEFSSTLALRAGCRSGGVSPTTRCYCRRFALSVSGKFTWGQVNTSQKCLPVYYAISLLVVE